MTLADLPAVAGGSDESQTEVSTRLADVFPAPWPGRLSMAARLGDTRGITRITQEMHRAGLVRDPADGSRFGRALGSAGDGGNPWGLLPSQIRVMDALIEVHTVPAVAVRLTLSRHTVGAHMCEVRERMSCLTALEAALRWDRWRRGQGAG